MGKTDGDYYTLDDMFVSKAAERERSGEEEENQRRKAIAEHQSLAAQMETCLYCFDSSQFPKHLIVAIGVKVRVEHLLPEEVMSCFVQICLFLETLTGFYLSSSLILCFKYFPFLTSRGS